MTASHSADDIEPALSAAEEELIHLLEEACRLEPETPGAETTDELLRLEGALLDAAKAAERALELRRRSEAAAGEHGAGGAAADGSTGDGLRAPPAGAADSVGVKEFADGSGRPWRVWAVTPGHRTGTGNTLDQLRAEYQKGWLTFETLDESERRRLPNYPADWHRRGVDELLQLLSRASLAAPRRFRTSSSASARSGEERQAQR